MSNLKILKSSRSINTPLGDVLATASEEGICEIKYTSEPGTRIKDSVNPDSGVKNDKPAYHLHLLEQELKSYFEGKLTEFTVSLDLSGTEFQLKVWKKLREIPYGETLTYAELAELLDSPNAVRAVGGANSKNPVMIVVPCHRVNGSKGKLTGYSGGLYAKKFLLDLESGKRSPVQTVLLFP